ncbi:MAG: ABC transporter permease [Candidatus Sumerlaeia bacterium]|nr:ABC transporter permease [Candidatus Sumerlaeia bacterium]
MEVARFILRRLLQAIPLLLGISLLSFLLINLAPGDPLARQRLDPTVSSETIRQFEIQFGFVDPETGERTSWLWQYGVWLKNIVTDFNFGHSFSTRQPVWSVIWDRTLATLWLSGCAMLIGLGIALPLGIYSAVRQYRWQDVSCSFFAFIGLSLPNVFLALLVLMFAAKTEILPLGGMRSLDYFERSAGGKILDLLWHVTGPALVLGTATMAVYMRQMRGNLLDVLESDYVRTARAKGLGESAVVAKHGVRNAVNPVITLFGFTLSDILSGSILVENVLQWPGLGRTVVEALVSKDLYLVMASVIMSSVLLIVGNLIADLLLAWSDPRIRLR